jgi:superfamily II DNA or RNA helicase
LLELRFHDGTLELHGDPPLDLALPDLRRDPRAACWRAPAAAYGAIALRLHRAGVPFADHARRWQPLPLRRREEPQPRAYQQEAVQAWDAAQRRGVVVLPTGAGKSLVAALCLAQAQRPALIVAPTLDLVRQWHGQLEQAFGVEVGVVGGGERRLLPVTVTTYDSAAAQMRYFGDRFGLIVFDEVHHLPGPVYGLAAAMALAPFRLGLTATPERADGGEARYEGLVGGVVYRQEIVEMSGLWLADYETHRLVIELDADERARYEEARQCYLDFARAHGVRLAEPGGFGRFLQLGAASPEGREAVQAFRLQRRLALSSRAKLREVGHLLDRHASDPTILFTNDNPTAYALARAFLIPVITHHTGLRERAEVLAGLRAGRYGAVVTSRVLNEGVDVPEAAVAIVVSGTGTVREHVQRLGRVLRRVPGKRATLYELVSAETSETFTSARRREHVAYQ